MLVYTAIDTDWHWLEAPHEGHAKHGSPEWREDGQFMHDWVSSHPEDYDWQVCDIEPDIDLGRQRRMRPSSRSPRHTTCLARRNEPGIGCGRIAMQPRAEVSGGPGESW